MIANRMTAITSPVFGRWRHEKRRLLAAKGARKDLHFASSETWVHVRGRSTHSVCGGNGEY